jgi:hypothetical protein
MTNSLRIKRSIVCKNVNQFDIKPELIDSYIPISGDVALFEVLSIGKHKAIQSDSGRNVVILKHDLIIASFGNRYATSQFEGYVPNLPVAEVDILGAGGVVGILKSKNAAFEDIEPTKLKLVGYLCEPGTSKVINTIGLGCSLDAFKQEVPGKAKVILSLGASMDSGKTTSAAFLVHGLKRTGAKVGFIKLTGTCYTKDKDFVFDCGADVTADFGDLGYPSTFLCSEEELLSIYQTLLNRFKAFDLDFIVMEIADGLYQRETSTLLNNPIFRATISNTLFSCADSLSAMQGMSWLDERGLKPFAICGLFTMSPLLIQEVEELSKTPVFDLDGLSSSQPALLLGYQGSNNN